MHQRVKSCIHSNPLEKTLTKLHGMMGDFIVEQAKTNEELKLKMYPRDATRHDKEPNQLL